jgi:hypothetical protein
MIDVLDNASGPGEVFPQRILLGWYAVDGADYYLVQEQFAAGWTTRQRIVADGRWYYTFRSRILEDQATHRFRVAPRTDAGLAGIPADYSVFMVRHPDPPSKSYSYNGATRVLTVSIAA